MKLNDLPEQLQPSHRLTEEQQKLFAGVVLIISFATGYFLSSWLGAGPVTIYWAMTAIYLGLCFVTWALHYRRLQTPPSTIKRALWVYCTPVIFMPIFMQLGAGVYSFIAAGSIYYCLKYYFKQAEKIGIKKSLFGVVMSCLLSVPTSAFAWGDASLGMQVVQNYQLIDGYVRQWDQLQESITQTTSMAQNLKEHQLGFISPKVNELASNFSRLLSSSTGKDIGSTMAKVDKDFADKFKNPTAALFADKFKGWSDHSSDALKASMLNAGLQRENFKSDEAALAALVKKNQQSDGNLAALKTLGELNAAQIQETQKLRDLMSQQVLAQNIHLEAQTTKEQAVQDMNDGVGKSIPIPTMEIPAKGKYKY